MNQETITIFVASPSDCDSERDEIRNCINRYNASGPQKIVKMITGEDTPPALGRPQQVINESIKTSDYLILLLKNKWGSSPGDESQYTSGTEEEFFVAIESALSKDRPMKNVAVFFLPGANPDIGVKNFRTMLEKSKSQLYQDCAKKPISELVGNYLEYLPAQIKPEHLSPELLFTSTNKTPIKAFNDYQRGLELCTEKLDDRAIKLLKDAVAGGCSEALEPLIRHTRNTKGNHEALKEIENIEESLRKANCLTSDYFILLVEKAQLLKSKKETNRARACLNTVLNRSDDDKRWAYIRAKAFDLLGNILRDQKEFSTAETKYTSAKEIRLKLEDEPGIILSELNLARCYLANFDYQIGRGSAYDSQSHLLARAQSRAEEAYHLCAQTYDSDLTANCYFTYGQIAKRRGEFEEALKTLNSALEINEQIGKESSVATCELTIAKVYSDFNNWEKSNEHLEKSAQINKKLGNQRGIEACDSFRKYLSDITPST